VVSASAAGSAQWGRPAEANRWIEASGGSVLENEGSLSFSDGSALNNEGG
jgi:hypothetical protein